MSLTDGNVTKLTRAELARTLGVSDESITNYVRKGMPVTGKGAGARYNLSACVQWMVDFEAEKKTRTTKSNSVTEDDAKVRKLVAEAQMKEYELAQLQGSVITVEDSVKEISTELEKVRNKLVAIPGVWGPQLVGLRDNAEAVETLSDLVHRLMEELSNETVSEDGENSELSEDEEEEVPVTDVEE